MMVAPSHKRPDDDFKQGICRSLDNWNHHGYDVLSVGEMNEGPYGTDKQENPGNRRHVSE